MKSLSYISAFVLVFALVVSNVLAAPQATENRVGAGTEGTLRTEGNVRTEQGVVGTGSTIMRTGELGSMQLPTGMFEVDTRGHPTMNAMCMVVSNYCMSMSDRNRVAEGGRTEGSRVEVGHGRAEGSRTGGVLAARDVKEAETAQRYPPYPPYPPRPSYPPVTAPPYSPRPYPPVNVPPYTPPYTPRPYPPAAPPVSYPPVNFPPFPPFPPYPPAPVFPPYPPNYRSRARQ